MSEKKDNIVMYDDGCNLCVSSVLFLRKNDRKRKLSFIPLSGQAIAVAEQAGDIQSIVFLSAGKTYRRSAAILHIFRTMGGLWKLLFAFIAVPVFLRDAMYNFVAARRYRWFGRRESCEVSGKCRVDKFKK